MKSKPETLNRDSPPASKLRQQDGACKHTPLLRGRVIERQFMRKRIKKSRVGGEERGATGAGGGDHLCSFRRRNIRFWCEIGKRLTSGSRERKRASELLCLEKGRGRASSCVLFSRERKPLDAVRVSVRVTQPLLAQRGAAALRVFLASLLLALAVGPGVKIPLICRFRLLLLLRSADTSRLMCLILYTIYSTYNISNFPYIFHVIYHQLQSRLRHVLLVCLKTVASLQIESAR